MVRHRLAGHPGPTTDPVVVEVLAGVRRDRGVSQDAKRAIWGHELRLVLAATPPVVRNEAGQLIGKGLLGLRDRAVLLLAFAAFARRSEVTGPRGLRWQDVEVRDDGVVLTLSASKTNQAGPAEVIGVTRGADPATCPVRALLARRDALAEQLAVEDPAALTGPLFRPVTRHGRLGVQSGGGEHDPLSPKAVAAIVKRYAVAAGLDPEDVAAHSLRSGAATTASERGAGELALMQQGRWKSVTMVKRYVQQGQALSGSNASRYFGL